ncbi:MAG: hypothetical protein KKD29_08030 [Candidatus Omnitrophica bacterium]|nr:hypothetical protein [Candidatus Omnitrophota bacterium]MBU4488846.1 hypothetical protein [Candidatus Omnitrophota bacterium]
MKKISVRHIWINTFGLIVKKPVIILPFFIIAFLEALTLELVYFSGRNPLAIIVGPIVKKFFGEGFTHYPYCIYAIPRVFNFLQIVIYVLAGTLLTAISINIFKNVKAGLPLKQNALLKNGISRYGAFVALGIIMVLIMLLLEKAGGFAFSKFTNLSIKYLPAVVMKIYPLVFAALLFLANAITQTFFIATLPLMVMDKKPLLKALLQSVLLGLRNFKTVFILVFLPFLLYFPITLLKGLSVQLAGKMFPEIILLILLLGVLATPFVECFVFISIAQFLLEKGERKEK